MAAKTTPNTPTFVPGPSAAELDAALGSAVPSNGATIEDARPAEQPKRGPGRPPGSGTKKAVPPTRTSNLETRIAAQLVSINMVLLLAPPLRADAMSQQEIQALAASLNAQAMQSAQFRKWLEMALTVGSSGELITIVGGIAARRAARHGIVPQYIDPMLGSMVFGEPTPTVDQTVVE